MKVLVKGNVLGKVKNILVKDFKKSDVSFLEAIDISLKQIEELKMNNPTNASYLDIQYLLINDPVFKNEVLKLIGDGKDVISSVRFVLDSFIKPLSESNDEYLKERVLDIEDIKDRILNNLSCNNNVVLEDKYIVVVDALHPSFLIENKNNILGVISRCGGTTSHSAILCRSWNIPYVVSNVVLNDFDDVLICDDIVVNPSNEIINKYISKYRNDIEVIRHDGYGFYANVFDNNDLDLCKDFDGVGLYRTEFIFMNSFKPLSVNEQAKIYKEALDKVKDIIFRTFDVGDDKHISYINTNEKGFNNYFLNLDVFKAQIKAFEQAGVKYIMFPMIRSKKEFNELKSYIYFDSKVGMMLETKEALDNIYDFYDVDFISIGTNDLVYELYGINRFNQCDDFSYLDDLLDKISTVVKFCKDNDIKLSLCGEIAGIEDIAYRLFKIGVCNLSVSVNKIDVLVSAYKKLTLG